MSGCHPSLGIHEDRGIKAHVKLILADELLSPSVLDIIFKLNAERAVIPGVGETAVDLASGIYKSSALAKSHDFVHCLFGVFHACHFI